MGGGGSDIALIMIFFNNIIEVFSRSFTIIMTNRPIYHPN